MSARLKPFGLGFARYAKSVALARGDALATQAFAEAKRFEWMDTPDVARVAKAAVDAISTGGDGSGLAIARPLANGFLELVRPHSLVDRILGLRQVPANIAMLRVTGAAAAGWIGEGAPPRQIGQFSFERETLLYDKLACTTVVTNELLHASGAIAEMVFAHELARGVAQFSDKAFIDPAFAAIPGVRPASISYGLTAISSSGATLAAVQADLKALFANFVAVDGALERAMLVMAPRTALALGMLTGSGGAPAFPTIGPRGGVLFVPVVTSSACIADGSPGESFMVLFDPAQIMIADDADVGVKVARHAAVQMNTAPDTGAQQLVSLWQNDLTALSVERSITWRRTADAGVAVLRDITY